MGSNKGIDLAAGLDVLDRYVRGDTFKTSEILEKLYPDPTERKRVQWLKVRISSKQRSTLLSMSLVVEQSNRSDVLGPIDKYFKLHRNAHLLTLTPKILEHGMAVLLLRVIKTKADNGIWTHDFIERIARHHELLPSPYIKRFDYIKHSVTILDFWLTAMKNNELLAEEISERDEVALKFLMHIKSSEMHDTNGFRLFFYFRPNPFFKQSILTKTYHLVDQYEPAVKKAIGTEIEWFPGRCLTQKPKKQSKNAMPITETEHCQSFFEFFSPPQVLDDSEDAAKKYQNLMEPDLHMGVTIQETIIPDAVSWFMGVAEDDDDDDDDGEIFKADGNGVYLQDVQAEGSSS